MTTSNEITQSLKGPQDEFCVYGLTAIKPNHPKAVRLYDFGNHPTNFGSRIWCSSYLLIDYLSRLSFASSQHVLELGCGWGLPGAYVQKHFGSKVTATDADVNVFAFQQLICQINSADVSCNQSSFAELCDQDFSSVDTLIGADICYSPDIAKQLVELFMHFFETDGKQVIIADRGRKPFHWLLDNLPEGLWAKITNLSLRLPTKVSGQVLHLKLH